MGDTVHNLGQTISNIPVVGNITDAIDKAAWQTGGGTFLGGEYGLQKLWGGSNDTFGMNQDEYADKSHMLGLAAATYGAGSALANAYGGGAAAGASTVGPGAAAGESGLDIAAAQSLVQQGSYPSLSAALAGGAAGAGAGASNVMNSGAGAAPSVPGSPSMWQTASSYLPSAKTAALVGAPLISSYLSGQSSRKQAEDLFNSRFPSQAAIETARNTGAATDAQNLLLFKRNLDEDLAARGMGGGYAAGQYGKLNREGMKIAANRNLALTQFANTPNSTGIQPYKTTEQQLAEMMAAAAGTAGGVYAYKNLFQ